MFRQIYLLLTGILFGIILSKAEIISWYRIQEMFRFQSFHMFGVIGIALILCSGIMLMIKRGFIKSMHGTKINIESKPPLYRAALIGGTVFGMGWALTGACPGPIYILIGNGYLVYLVVLLSAISGAFIHGLIRPKLPH